MDKKILAVVAVVIIVVAAVGVYFAVSDREAEDKEINIIGRVNTDGSAIVAKPSVDVDALMTVQTGTYDGDEPHVYDEASNQTYIFHVAAWGGMIVGTPGVNAIQQIQMQDFVTNTLGLEYREYRVGSDLNSNTVYYNYSINSYDKMSNTEEVQIAIMWEPQCALANIMGGYMIMVTTNVLFSGHTCCVLAGSHSWMSSHTNETVRFLAAYNTAVEQMNKIISEKDTNPEAYNELMDIAVNNISFPSGTTEAQKVQIIEKAWEIVVYKSCDDITAADPLSQLKTDIADLVDDLYANGNINKNASDLGFDSSKAFADKYVDSSYIQQAAEYQLTGDESTVNITVAVISGDIHQLAIHYAMAMNIFEEYGINITLSQQPNGDGVAVALENGSAQIGFIGAPPMTIKVINSEYVTA